MTDGKYLFEQTTKDRKRTARGAYAKKGGSRSKRCSLPSDYLTAKQRKELNGAVETISEKQKLARKEWQKLSKNMKEQYLEILFAKHNARVKDIAEMWGIGQNNVWRVFNAAGIDANEIVKKSKAYRKNNPSPEWLAFIACAEGEKPEVMSTPVDEKKAPPEAPSDVKLNVPDELDVPEIVKGKLGDDNMLLRVVSGTLNYEGDPYAIFEKVMLALDPSKQYKIQVRFQVCNY